MTYTAKTHTEANATVKKIAAEAGNLPVYFGTGYAIEKPHVLAVNYHSEVFVTVYPTGEKYMGTDHTHIVVKINPAS